MQEKISDEYNAVLLATAIAFEDFAVEIEKTFKEVYELDEPAIVASSTGKMPKSGSLKSASGETIEYQFHGNGCKTILPNGGIVDINYDSKLWAYNGFNVYTLRNYLHSTSMENWSNIDIEIGLKILENANKIHRPNPEFERFMIKR